MPRSSSGVNVRVLAAINPNPGARRAMQGRSVQRPFWTWHWYRYLCGTGNCLRIVHDGRGVVLRETAAMKLLKRILVATDFSPAGQRAVTRAGLLAHQHEADLLVLHVTPDWNLFSRWTSSHPQHYEAINQYAQRALREEVNRILGIYA